MEDDSDVVIDRDLNDNGRNRKKLEALERRRNHLRERVKLNPRLSFDAEECGALSWAIRVLREVLRDSNQK